MKQITLFSKFLFLFALVGFFTACDPDPILTDDPTSSLVDEAGFLTVASTVDAGTTFKVKLTASKSVDSEMNTLKVNIDGSPLATSLYTIDGTEDNNPKLLFLGDRTSFTYEIEITAHDSGTSTYSFIVDSDDGGSTTESIEITINDVIVDPILVNDMNASVVLTNPGTVKVVLTGTKGSSPLNFFSVYEEGALITDMSRLTWGADQFTDNPLVLQGDDKEGFTKEFFIKSLAIVQTTNYTFTLTDENGQESSVDFSITLNPLMTDLTTEYKGVSMFNNAGPSFGAIDLETGTNVSSGDATADLVDLGNDVNGDWRMQMEPYDTNTSLRSIISAFNYELVTTEELLIQAYDAGTELDFTGTLTVGSTYVAKIGDEYFIMKATEVNNTGADNLDTTVWDIKRTN